MGASGRRVALRVMLSNLSRPQASGSQRDPQPRSLSPGRVARRPAFKARFISFPINEAQQITLCACAVRLQTLTSSAPRVPPRRHRWLLPRAAGALAPTLPGMPPGLINDTQPRKNAY